AGTEPLGLAVFALRTGFAQGKTGSFMKKTTLGFLAFVVIGINTALWLGLKSHPGISAENGPMENFQAACLGLGFLIWLVASFRTKNRAEQILLAGLALFYFSFLILEVDFRKFHAPILNTLFNGRIRDAWLGCLWLGAGIIFYKNANPAWKEFLDWLKNPCGILIIVSGAHWLASGLIDKSFTARKELYHEELLEVNASLLMLLSSILFLLRKRENSKAGENATKNEPQA
ncbi:MAG: hypothetical protein ABIP71_10390, partial [Verrucomicrobiota bacterium]